MLICLMKYILEARKEACFLYLNLPGIERQFVCVFVNQTQLIFYSFFGHLEQRVLTDKQQFWTTCVKQLPLLHDSLVFVLYVSSYAHSWDIRYFTARLLKECSRSSTRINLIIQIIQISISLHNMHIIFKFCRHAFKSVYFVICCLTNWKCLTLPIFVKMQTKVEIRRNTMHLDILYLLCIIFTLPFYKFGVC